MAFKAVFHEPDEPDQLREIHKIIARFRAEKAVKYLGAMGVSYDAVRELLPRERPSKEDSGAG